MLHATKKLLAFISYPFFTFHLALCKVVSRRILKKETVFNISNTVYKTWFILRKFNFEAKLRNTEHRRKRMVLKIGDMEIIGGGKKIRKLISGGDDC